MKFNSPYNHDKSRSSSFATINQQESMTQQSDAADCDINIIMKKYGGAGGQLPHVIGTPLTGDFTDTMDYRTMVETLRAADTAFQEIPADIRGRFLNDPDKFIKFANDPANLEELRKLGLAKPAAPPPTPPEPMLVRVVPDPEPPK